MSATTPAKFIKNLESVVDWSTVDITWIEEGSWLGVGGGNKG